MRYTAQERGAYNKDRQKVCELLGITKNQYNAFRRIGSALKTAYEQNCNGVFQTEQEYLDIIAPLEAKAVSMAGKVGLYVYFQTDPRGATIYLDTKPIPKDNYTSGRCIY